MQVLPALLLSSCVQHLKAVCLHIQLDVDLHGYFLEGALFPRAYPLASVLKMHGLFGSHCFRIGGEDSNVFNVLNEFWSFFCPAPSGRLFGEVTERSGYFWEVREESLIPKVCLQKGLHLLYCLWFRHVLDSGSLTRIHLRPSEMKKCPRYLTF